MWQSLRYPYDPLPPSYYYEQHFQSGDVLHIQADPSETTGDLEVLFTNNFRCLPSRRFPPNYHENCEIFFAVAKAIRALIHEANPRSITLPTMGTNSRRERVYRKFARRIARLYRGSLVSGDGFFRVVFQLNNV